MNVLRTSYVIFGIIIFSNIYCSFCSLDAFKKPYTFASASGNFFYTLYPTKAKSMDVLESHYQFFLDKNHLQREKLYHIQKVSLHKFWDWHEMIFPDRAFKGYQRKIKLML